MTCFYSLWDRAEFGEGQDTGCLDFRFLVSGPEAEGLAERVDPDLIQRMGYRSVNADHWAVLATLIIEGDTPEGERAEAIRLIEDVQRAQRNFVIRAAHTSAGGLRKRSNFARFNCVALVAYAREEIGVPGEGTPVPFLDPRTSVRAVDMVQASGGTTV